jgi:hypothetical protein
MDLEILLGWRRPALRLLSTANAAIYHKLRESLQSGDFGRSTESGWPMSDLSTKMSGLRAMAQLRPDPDEIAPFLDGQELAAYQTRMAAHVQAMSDLTADALYDFRWTIVHRCALWRKRWDWFLRRADDAQSATGH